ncbi:MAG: amino acid racemase [Proteobacteria bacterium]|nr:amino acid racemase [Pseudomonadota bacterium]
MAGHIGIVACSAEGASLCYRTICTEGEGLFGPHGHPEVSMHTPPFQDYMACIYKDDWKGVAELMLGSAQKLAAIGADFVICPDNTIHQALPHIEARLPVPWLHIADAVGAEAASRGFRKIGLTGTRWLVDSTVYPQAYVRPTPAERAEINRFIMDELVKGVRSPQAIAYFQNVIGSLKDQGCEAVVLGCTEIPLIIDDGNSALPTLDSTRLLARAALKRAAS